MKEPQKHIRLYRDLEVWLRSQTEEAVAPHRRRLYSKEPEWCQVYGQIRGLTKLLWDSVTVIERLRDRVEKLEHILGKGKN